MEPILSSAWLEFYHGTQRDLLDKYPKLITVLQSFDWVYIENKLYYYSKYISLSNLHKFTEYTQGVRDIS